MDGFTVVGSDNMAAEFILHRDINMAHLTADKKARVLRDLRVKAATAMFPPIRVIPSYGRILKD